jgi:hypothetical protein
LLQVVLDIETSAFCVAVLWFGQMSLNSFYYQLILDILNWAAAPDWTTWEKPESYPENHN